MIAEPLEAAEVSNARQRSSYLSRRGTSTDKGLRVADDRFEPDRGLDSAPVVN